MTRRRHLSIRPEWDTAIREGRKTVDARPVADDIAEVIVGGIIRYPGARVRVTHMRYYPSIGDLLAHENRHQIDPDATEPDELRRTLEDGHTVTLQDRGAVAIEFELIGAEG